MSDIDSLSFCLLALQYLQKYATNDDDDDDDDYATKRHRRTCSFSGTTGGDLDCSGDGSVFQESTMGGAAAGTGAAAGCARARALAGCGDELPQRGHSGPRCMACYSPAAGGGRIAVGGCLATVGKRHG